MRSTKQCHNFSTALLVHDCMPSEADSYLPICLPPPHPSLLHLSLSICASACTSRRPIPQAAVLQRPISAELVLRAQGALPGYLAAVIIGRDVFLVGATFTTRAHQLGWRRVPLRTFFRVTAAAGPQVPPPPSASDGRVCHLCVPPSFLRLLPPSIRGGKYHQ